MLIDYVMPKQPKKQNESDTKHKQPDLERKLEKFKQIKEAEARQKQPVSK